MIQKGLEFTNRIKTEGYLLPLITQEMLHRRLIFAVAVVIDDNDCGVQGFIFVLNYGHHCY